MKIYKLNIKKTTDIGRGLFAAKEIKIPSDPEGRGIFNPPTGKDNRGRASGYSTQLKEIKNGELLFVFKGKLMKERDKALKLKCTLQTGKNKWIEPGKNSPGRYLNHSCSPNAGIKGKQKIVAIRSIKNGEQITLDYSTTDDDPNWKMNCKCKSENCRKTIKSIQYLPKDLFLKYKPIIPSFLQKAYMLH